MLFIYVCKSNRIIETIDNTRYMHTYTNSTDHTGRYYTQNTYTAGRVVHQGPFSDRSPPSPRQK